MKPTESLIEWLYDYQIESSARELVVLMLLVFGLLFLQGYLSARDAEIMANEYKVTIAEKEREIDGLTGNMDCIFTGYEFTHTWKNACYVGLEGVEVRK